MELVKRNDTMMKELYDVINECEYVKNCKSNKKKDKESFSYLVTEIEISQSDCIKLGNGFEKIMRDLIIRKNKNIRDIKKKNEKGIKEKDHLFCNDKEKIIYYAEFKTNLNLDTEKSKSTYSKCQEIVKELADEYKDYEIKWCLLGCRYINKNEITKTIQAKYNIIKEHVFGVNDYLEMVKIDIVFDEISYKDFINKIAVQMFQDK